MLHDTDTCSTSTDNGLLELKVGFKLLQASSFKTRQRGLKVAPKGLCVPQRNIQQSIIKSDTRAICTLPVTCRQPTIHRLTSMAVIAQGPRPIYFACHPPRRLDADGFSYASILKQGTEYVLLSCMPSLWGEISTPSRTVGTIQTLGMPICWQPLPTTRPGKAMFVPRSRKWLANWWAREKWSLVTVPISERHVPCLIGWPSRSGRGYARPLKN